MTVDTVLLAATLAAVGFASWSFVEYAIHGLLAHRFQTFVSPLHGQHHREPWAVFTAPLAWVPGMALFFGLLSAAVGARWAAPFSLGLLLGFARYEYEHWRIHFRLPRTPRERLLREHHLAHHFRNPRAYCGVTTRFWDRVFGTLPADAAGDYAAVADRPPLPGASNFLLIWNPKHAIARFRSARRSAG